MDTQFMAGKELSRQLALIVEPALRELVPRMPFALAFIGTGSDVLGYDTACSMDHDWGPRLTIVVPEQAGAMFAKAVDEAIDQLLPPTIAGFPTRFSYHADGTLLVDAKGAVHHLNVTSVGELLRGSLLIDSPEEITDAVWLSTSMQTLLELTSGEVFSDDTGELTRLRRALAFYPDHVWRYQLPALWMRIGQGQPFIGRTGEVGDDLGSATITIGIARDLMRITLLQSRQYAPYAKWLGTAFTRTGVGASMQPHLAHALEATSWQQREQGINAAGVMAIEHLNALGLIPSIPSAPARFHTRPFHVLPAEDIAVALHGSLRDTPLGSLTPYVGGIDVITDSTDALKSVPFRLAMRAMFARQSNI